LSLGGKETSKVAKRVRRMPSVIPSFKFTTNAVTELQVDRGGTITFAPSTDNAVRSLESTHDLLFDEAAFVPNEEEIYSGAVPSQEMVGADARTWVISTMSQAGALCWFWSEMFSKNNGAVDVTRAIARAQEGLEPFQYWIDENGWAKVIVHWKAHPVYALIPDYLLKVKTEKKIPDDKLQREYNLGLPQGRGSLFGSDESIQRNAVGRWQEPVEGRYYLAGLDPNFGGNNRFNLLIWDITEKPYSLVYQYRSNQGTISYHGSQAIAAIQRYQPVITVIEKNSGGAVIREKLIQECPDLAIESVWMSASSKPVHTDRIAFHSESGDVIYPPDWEGCSSWKDDDGTVYPSEMSQFSATNREAISGTDDAVMSWAIAFAYLAEAVGEVERLERVRVAQEAIAGSVSPLPRNANLWG